MPIKIENLATGKLPKKTIENIEGILGAVPREHTRGLDRLRLVDTITDPRVRIPSSKSLPGLYHPRQGPVGAWLEIAVDALLPRSQPFFKRIMPRMSFKGNVAAVIFSLVGQHYYSTLRHSVKKTQLESSVRTYVEKNLKAWAEQQHTWRSKIFKPLQPTMDRWARALQKRAAREKKKSTS